MYREQEMAGPRRQIKVQRVTRYRSSRRAADRDKTRSGNRRTPSHRAVAEAGTDDEAGPEGVAPYAQGGRAPRSLRHHTDSIATEYPRPWSRSVYLLDTNVVSELRRPRPHGAVLDWIADVAAEQLFVSAVTVGEIQTGIEITREQDEARAEELEGWLDKVLVSYGVLTDGRSRLPGVGTANAQQIRHRDRGCHDSGDSNRSQTDGGHSERARLWPTWRRVAESFRKRLATAALWKVGPRPKRVLGIQARSHRGYSSIRTSPGLP